MFTQSKFRQLPPLRQQKNCAEILRKIYELALSGQSFSAALLHYNEIQGWLQAPPLDGASLESIADRYHHHLQSSGTQLKEHRLLPRVRTVDAEAAKAATCPIHIYLDKLRSAHNVGSILRTTEAFALGEVIFSEYTPTPLHKQVSNTAMGCAEWVNWSQRPLSDCHQPIIALETSPDAIPLTDFQFPESFTLVLGNEEYGCSKEALAQADHLVEIPLFGRKNSLNVANAFAIAAATIRAAR